MIPAVFRTSAFLSGVALIVGSWAFVAHEREVGALNARLAVADSVSRVAVAAQAVQHDSAVAARRTADSLRVNARREVARDAVVRQHTDSVLAASATERLEAVSVLADSLAQVDALRGALTRMVEAGVRDSVAFAVERGAFLRDQRILLAVVASDSTAIQRGVAAENAAIARSVASERQRDLLRSARPSAVGNVLRSAAWVAVGLGVGRLIR